MQTPYRTEWYVVRRGFRSKPIEADSWFNEGEILVYKETVKRDTSKGPKWFFVFEDSKKPIRLAYVQDIFFPQLLVKHFLIHYNLLWSDLNE